MWEFLGGRQSTHSLKVKSRFWTFVIRKYLFSHKIIFLLLRTIFLTGNLFKRSSLEAETEDKDVVKSPLEIHGRVNEIFKTSTTGQTNLEVLKLNLQN